MEVKTLKVKDILNITNGELLYGDVEIKCENFSKDTREINKGDIYVGIKGDSFDGSAFFEKALQEGAAGCIVQNVEVGTDIYEKYPNTFIIKVSDTIVAVQDIARYKRSLYDVPVIAVTGSVGKTSTRDIIASVMSQKYKVLKTEGNYNNHIGLPFTILKAKDHTAMVLEMGMNQKGEIEKLVGIAKPTVAVITNVGTAHIGNLGSRENILSAKLEILKGLKKNGTLVINNDNDILHNWHEANKEKKAPYSVVTFGIDEKSDYQINSIELSEDSSKYSIALDGKEEEFYVPIGGKHFITNSLCAIAIGKMFNISIDDIRVGIKKFELTKRRMDIEEVKDRTLIINDSYNASYDSMKASLEYLASINKPRKIAILGDMLELGRYSEELHRKVGSEVAKNNIDILVTVGKEAKYIADETSKENADVEVYSFDTNDEAIKEVCKIAKGEDVILVKASNSMRFDKIVEELKKYFKK